MSESSEERCVVQGCQGKVYIALKHAGRTVGPFCERCWKSRMAATKKRAMEEVRERRNQAKEPKP